MKVINILKYFIFFSFFILLFSKPVFAADEVTDVKEIFDMFNFNNSSDSELLDNSMSFSGAENSTQGNFWNKILTEYKGVIVGVSGVCTLTFILLFLINFTKLGTTAGNPQARKTTQINLLWTGLCAAAAGAVTVFVGFSFYLIR